MTAPNTDRPLSDVALVCSLEPSPAESWGYLPPEGQGDSALMAGHVCEQLRGAGVTTESVRCVDYAITPGVEADMGDGDEWPQIREKLIGADIVVLTPPIWLGHRSSVTQRVLERLDAELSNTDDADTPIMVGKVAVVAVVGNEDGAHKVIADCFPGLNDIGYTIPAQGGPPGPVRRWRARTSRTSTRCPTPSRRRTLHWRATPHTSQTSCGTRNSRPTSDVRSSRGLCTGALG